MQKTGEMSFLTLNKMKKIAIQKTLVNVGFDLPTQKMEYIIKECEHLKGKTIQSKLGYKDLVLICETCEEILSTDFRIFNEKS